MTRVLAALSARVFWALLLQALLRGWSARAETAPSAAMLQEDRVETRISAALAARYPGARIELTRSISWGGGEAPYGMQSVAILDESPRGDLRVLVRGRDADGQPRDAEAYASFAAWVPARAAVRRILPGEKLSPELFAMQEANVVSGPAHEFRGVILPVQADVRGLETRQTILEGQLLLSTAVQHVPDIRRGEPVRIRLVSGDLVLSTSGTAEEPAYQDGKVRVLTAKTKRELTGTLRSGGIVEVTL